MASVDKLDGKISEDLWGRKMSEWQFEQHQVRLATDGLVGAEAGDRALRCAESVGTGNKAHLLYLAQSSAEKAELLRMLCFELFCSWSKRNACIQIIPLI